MAQLKLGSVLNLITHLNNIGMAFDEIAELPIYIGNDEEMNGIHTAYYVEQIAEEDSKYEIEMINEDSCNVKFNSKAILIS